MSKIVVDPNGTEHEFPDEATPEQIRGAISQHMGYAPPSAGSEALVQPAFWQDPVELASMAVPSPAFLAKAGPVTRLLERDIPKVAGAGARAMGAGLRKLPALAKSVAAKTPDIVRQTVAEGALELVPFPVRGAVRVAARDALRKVGLAGKEVAEEAGQITNQMRKRVGSTLERIRASSPGGKVPVRADKAVAVAEKATKKAEDELVKVAEHMRRKPFRPPKKLAKAPSKPASAWRPRGASRPVLAARKALLAGQPPPGTVAARLAQEAAQSGGDDLTALLEQSIAQARGRARPAFDVPSAAAPRPSMLEPSIPGEPTDLEALLRGSLQGATPEDVTNALRLQILQQISGGMGP